MKIYVITGTQGEWSMKIYVVTGTQGEYSDRLDWTVCAYTERDQAQEHARRATEFTRVDDPDRGTNPYDTVNRLYDPHFAYDDAVEYVVVEVELFQHVDQMLENTEVFLPGRKIRVMVEKIGEHNLYRREEVSLTVKGTQAFFPIALIENAVLFRPGMENVTMTLDAYEAWKRGWIP